MKSINLLSLVQAFKSLPQNEFDVFLKHHAIQIRTNEASDLENLTLIIQNYIPTILEFENFYVGFKIKQISKEFDLLKFGSNYNINIELKRNSSEESIKTQLIKNKRYLRHLSSPTHFFTYIAESNTLYLLDINEQIITTSIQYLVNVILNHQPIKIVNPDNLFNPSDYLVSPFNSTEKFIAEQYFLTSHQDEIKNKIIQKISSYSNSFISLTGSAGTGKTLLTYDIAKKVMLSSKVTIVHCGYLNSGHHKLIAKGWNIIPIRNFHILDKSKTSLIIIDETQRIRPVQLQKLIDESKIYKFNCILSYDKAQTLHKDESRFDIESELSILNNHETFSLSEKIRTNKEVSDFIKILFNNKKYIEFTNNGNVDFVYFDDINCAKIYTDMLSVNGWEILRTTPSRYNKEYHTQYYRVDMKNSHDVIGQEFDNVAVIIDQFYHYDSNTGNLAYAAITHYDSVGMLFQNITRTRNKLRLIILKNQIILNRCLTQLNR